MPQSSWSRWGAAAPVSAVSTRLFSTTIPRLNDNRDDDRLPTEKARDKPEQQRLPEEEKPLFTKVQAPGDDWALFHGRQGAQVFSKHIQLSLEGLKPFGAPPIDPFWVLQAPSQLALLEARKRYDRSKKAQWQPTSPSLLESEHPGESWTGEGGDFEKPQDALKEAEKSREINKANCFLPRAYTRPNRMQYADGWETLSWRSIMHHNNSGNIGKKAQLSQEAQGPKDPDRRSQPNKIEITITRQQGGELLESPETGALKEALAVNSGFGSWAETPKAVQATINRHVRVTAGKTSSISALPPATPVARPPQHKPPPPKSQEEDIGMGEFAWVTASKGPAESVQHSLVEDPILKEAGFLLNMHLRPPFSADLPSKLDTQLTPRFRVLPTRQWAQRTNAIAQNPKSGYSEPGPLGLPRTSTNGETGAQQGQKPVRQFEAFSSQPGTAKSTALQEMEAQILAQSVPFKYGAQAASDKPVQPERSLFDQLFSEERPRGRDYWRIADRLRSAFSAVDNDIGLGDRPEREAPARTSQPGQSIYAQLFPEEVESWSDEGNERMRGNRQEPLTPPKDSLMISLRNEVRNWIPEDQQGRITGPQPGEYGSHSTVVVMSGMSPSLIDTDFYRIAPEGKHVEGWAGGLVKVVQARDSITFEPLGQYYLMFHSRPSALAYVDEVERLHALSRKLLYAPGDSGKLVAKGALDQAPATPQPFLTEEEKAAVRSFTLMPPRSSRNISIRLWNTQLVAAIASKSNIADVVQALRPEATTPAKVLLKFTPLGGGIVEEGGGGGLTAEELWMTLRDDGRERNAPWILASRSKGIMPVKPMFRTAQSGIRVRAQPVSVPLDPEDEVYDGGGADGDGEEGGGEVVAGQLPPATAGERLGGSADRNERFSRFVLTFAQPAIARRFVRCWHKRVIYDAVLGRSVVVDAVALM